MILTSYSKFEFVVLYFLCSKDINTFATNYCKPIFITAYHSSKDVFLSSFIYKSEIGKKCPDPSSIEVILDLEFWLGKIM